MELRHLRYFLAVSEASSFTKAAARLRVAQPALSRQVQDLEEEIGVDLLKRSRQGVVLTAEGRLFAEEIRKILDLTVEAVEKVRALTRGQCGELHVGYAAAPTVEILPTALAAFQKAWPRVNVVLHDLMPNELFGGLEDGTLALAVIPGVAGSSPPGIKFEVLRTYAFCAAMPQRHRLSRLKSVPVDTIAGEPLVGLRRKENPGYYQVLDRVFASACVKPRFAVECDTISSLITAVEAGRGIAVTMEALKLVSGKRLVIRRLAGTNEVFSVGIARAKNGDLTPAGEKLCEVLRTLVKAKTTGTSASRGLGSADGNQTPDVKDTAIEQGHSDGTSLPPATPQSAA